MGMSELSRGYLTALVNPFSGVARGMKVPDASCLMTATFQQSTEGVATCDGAGFLAFSLFAQQAQTPIRLSNTVLYGPAASATSSGTALNAFDFTNVASSNTLFQSWRPTSFGFVVKPIMSGLSDQGLIVCWLGPRGTTALNTATTAFAMPENRTFSVREAERGVLVSGKVQDNDDWIFSNVNQVRSVPCVGFVATGLTANAQVYIKGVVNYEAVPANDTLTMVEAAPSPVDEVGMGYAHAAVSGVPTIFKQDEVAGVTASNVISFLSQRSGSELASIYRTFVGTDD